MKKLNVKTNIIFDIDGVLFKENKLKIIRKSGLLKMLFYLITHRKNPVKIGYDVFKRMHEAWGQNKTPSLIYKKKPMPECITQWMKGFISNKALLENIDKFIENLQKVHYFASEFEKNLIQQSIKIVLDDSEIPTNIKPIHPMIQLVTNLKHNSQHNLFVLSNYSKQASDKILKKHQKFFSLFDDVLISANIGMIKPDKEIFDYFLHKHNVLPQDCIFIDDQEQNVQAAQNVGITSLQYSDTEHDKIIYSLQKLGVL